MFSRWRVQLKISGRLAYISHLDVLSALERSLRRASLPMRFSEGFNPHMLISFGPAHAVGVLEDALYCDMDFAIDPPSDWQARLQKVMPEGLAVVQARQIEKTEKSLMAMINLAIFELDFANENIDIEGFLSKDSYIIERVSPKGKKILDIRPAVLVLQKTAAQKVHLQVRLGIKGSPKAKEVSEVIAPDNALVSLCRTGLFIEDEQGRHLP